MRPAQIGVIHDIDVTRFRRCGFAAGDAGNQGAGGELHHADEDRQPLGPLCDQAAIRGGIDPVGAVIGFGNYGGKGGAREGQVHLVADLLQTGLDHGEGDGIKHGTPL
jgi:hypothetical protein